MISDIGNVDENGEKYIVIKHKIDFQYPEGIEPYLKKLIHEASGRIVEVYDPNLQVRVYALENKIKWCFVIILTLCILDLTLFVLGYLTKGG